MQKWKYLFAVFQWNAGTGFMASYAWRLTAIDGKEPPKDLKLQLRIEVFHKLGTEAWEFAEYIKEPGAEEAVALFKRPLT